MIRSFCAYCCSAFDAFEINQEDYYEPNRAHSPEPSTLKSTDILDLPNFEKNEALPLKTMKEHELDDAKINKVMASIDRLRALDPHSVPHESKSD